MHSIAKQGRTPIPAACLNSNITAWFRHTAHAPPISQQPKFMSVNKDWPHTITSSRFSTWMRLANPLQGIHEVDTLHRTILMRVHLVAAHLSSLRQRAAKSKCGKGIGKR
ncbi:hypothetical protein VNO77_27747 [Canavalia gladiata]|uniref:Uncharacterized protein n=1 Tax=Canavalia gladiata TaxID=3824 RepID=A0AAN9KYE3_CANGL